MRHIVLMILLGLISSAIFVGSARAQESAQERAAGLRVQLSAVQAKQSELQERLKKLDEDVKPENIEHSLTAVGSTHPEDLREQRRRQIELERTGVLAQLDQLSLSRARLEQSIVDVDAQAYQQIAPVESIGTKQQQYTSAINTQPTRNHAINTWPSRRIRRNRTIKRRANRRTAVQIHVVFA